jgi:hypothetical protein
MKRTRTPGHKVNKRQRADAIKALHATVTDDASPTYAHVRAATALLGGKGAQYEADEVDPDAPIVRQIAPWNSRPALVRVAGQSESWKLGPAVAERSYSA